MQFSAMRASCAASSTLRAGDGCVIVIWAFLTQAIRFCTRCTVARTCPTMIARSDCITDACEPTTRGPCRLQWAELLRRRHRAGQEQTAVAAVCGYSLAGTSSLRPLCLCGLIASFHGAWSND